MMVIGMILVIMLIIIFYLDIDNLISINGMVVRTSNIIPEMREGDCIHTIN